MSRKTTLAAFTNVHRGQSRGADAPHKPLLIIYALGQWLHLGKTEFRFVEVEEPLGNLLRNPGFGGVDSATPRDPFWFLTSDGVWVVRAASGAEISYAGDRPTLKEMREQDARGRFSDAVRTDLFESPGLALELVGRLLCEYFAPAHHRAILESVGLWLRSPGGGT